MKYLILPRRVSLLILGKEDSNNYTASCQININGKYGTIDSLIGSDLYVFLKANGFNVFKELGLIEVSAVVSDSHLILIKRYLKNTNISIIENNRYKESENFYFNYITFKEKAH